MMYEIVVTQFKKTLENLSHILDKGEELANAKQFDMDVLLHARLVPDQFNLIRQVQISCDTAKFCVARLTAQNAPSHADDEKTVGELKERIASVTEYLGSFKSHDFKDASSRRVSTPRWKEKYLLGEEYVIQHAVPNLFFHVTTAYAILRHNGVNVGKKDFLGEMPFKD